MRGDVIARTGQTAAVKEPAHLHFEIRTSAKLGYGTFGRLQPGLILGEHYQPPTIQPPAVQVDDSRYEINEIPGNSQNFGAEP